MSQVRENIQSMALLATALRLDTTRDLLTMLDACNGKTTLHHLNLYRAKRDVDWALENLAKIKVEIDAACDAAEAATAQERAA